jgi:tetratricopeptide (TPR) repeat protein
MTKNLQPPDLHASLEEFLMSRNVEEGFRLLDSATGVFERIKSKDRTAIALALCLAQWVDLGYRDLHFLESIIENLPARSPDLPFVDVIRLQLLKAYHCLATEDSDQAILCLERSLSGVDMLPPSLIFVTHFWKGRAHRKKGDYANAALHILAARECAEAIGRPKLVAVTKIHESWLAFQNGETARAFKLLDEAEIELKPMGHALSLGNIESARGRFVRRTGDYAESLAHFEKAIAIYENGFSNHPNLARALVNAAYVKRLLALELRPTLYREHARGSLNVRYLKLTNEGLSLLSRAGKIYEKHHHQGGTGSVLVNSGFLHLESGDMERAAVEALRAYKLGSEMADVILMARATSLQSAVERAKAEEQIDGEENVDAHLQRAVKYADRAIELAKSTQNRRLIAEAYLARGFAALDETGSDLDVARRCASEAGLLLSKNDRDHLFKELAELKLKILRSAGVDDALRRWSEGQLGQKSFQQVQEEFAELVILRVWQNLGRSVSRVSKELSISPKKVRRLLQKADTKNAVRATRPRTRIAPAAEVNPIIASNR